MADALSWKREYCKRWALLLKNRPHCKPDEVGESIGHRGTLSCNKRTPRLLRKAQKSMDIDIAAECSYRGRLSSSATWERWEGRERLKSMSKQLQAETHRAAMKIFQKKQLTCLPFGRKMSLFDLVYIFKWISGADRWSWMCAPSASSLHRNSNALFCWLLPHGETQQLKNVQVFAQKEI